MPDPLEVLRNIIDGRHEKEKQSKLNRRPRRLVKDIDFGKLSLEEYAKVNGNSTPQDSADVVATIDVYQDGRQKFEDLHQSIANCDNVLQSVETYLTRFQAELGQVSAEIESLQTRSVEMNGKLENRKKVEQLLGPAVEDISISPVTVRTIAEGPVDESFIAALRELQTRSATIESKFASGGNVRSVEDVRPLLDNLRSKALERIRDYTVAQIKSLRSPSINAQILQQERFLKYKYLFSFLANLQPTLADEISQAYINTMRWYYVHHFNRYHAALQGLQIHTIDQNDILGADPATSRKSNLLAGSKGSVAAHDAFGLGRRADILKSTTSAISSYLASEMKAPQYMEVPFQNFNAALIDNVCFEFGIDTEIFAKKSFQEVSRKVLEIFEPIFGLGRTMTKTLIEQSTDCLGVLLCVRLNQRFAFELQRRKVPVAESYINGTNMLLWPRFQQIMDMHCDSLRKAANSSLASRNTTNTALSLVGAGGGSDTSKGSSVAPHLITQRFGQFLHGILALSSEAGDDEPVSNSLNRLRNEYDNLMIKMSKGLGGDQRKRHRFLENQYSLILTILGDVEGKLADEAKASLEIKLKEAKK